MWDFPLYTAITLKNKGTALGEQSKARKTKLNAPRKEAELRKSHKVVAGVKHAKTLVSYSPW